MQQNSERWMELAAQATVEQDPDKLVALVLEITELLEHLGFCQNRGPLLKKTA